MNKIFNEPVCPPGVLDPPELLKPGPNPGAMFGLCGERFGAKFWYAPPEMGWLRMLCHLAPGMFPIEGPEARAGPLKDPEFQSLFEDPPLPPLVTVLILGVACRHKSLDGAMSKALPGAFQLFFMVKEGSLPGAMPPELVLVIPKFFKFAWKQMYEESN